MQKIVRESHCLDEHMHTSALRPTLTEQNKLARILFILEQINQVTDQYDPQFDRVHIDEKWFFLTRNTVRYYLAEGEEPPIHITFSPKAMS
jgi:hypothetical protein